MLTLIIPTKNRPNDLKKAIESLLLQTRLPDELIIVDQSDDYESKLIVDKNFLNYFNCNLIYIHNRNIKGLVDAKHVGVEKSLGDIICFIEDDVVLEAEYLKQIELGFSKKSNMIGCSGVITNPPKIIFFYKFLFKIFHRGIFKDKRIDVHKKYNGYNNNFIMSNMLSGGVSAWRREVFENVKFDMVNGFHMLEDIDFSTRVAKHFGNCLYINPNVRLAHYSSQTNRDVLDIRQRRKVRECFTYYKKRKDWSSATISFYWLLIGMLLEALFLSFSCVSLKPIHGYLLGLQDGYAKKIIS